MRALLLASALVVLPAVAHADLLLTFGQSGAGQTITATAAGGLTTHIAATDAAINITQILGGVPTIGYFDLSIDSTDAATPLGAGGFQHYAGTFSINSLANNTGINYLSGAFNDVVLGVGPSGVLAAGSPPDIINFSSDVITTLGSPSAIALSFANVSPAFSIDGATIGSFTSSVSGTFSASEVPEPATLGILGLGLLGLVAARRRHA